MEYICEIKELHKSYGKAEVLKGVNMSIKTDIKIAPAIIRAFEAFSINNPPFFFCIILLINITILSAGTEEISKRNHSGCTSFQVSGL